MAKQRVVIEISPSRLELALLKGQTAASRKSQRIQLGSYSENWPGVLDAAQTQLAALVNEMGVRDAEATLLYAGPTASTVVFSCPENAGAAQAVKAATLALGEAAGFPLAANPHDIQRLTSDASAAGPNGEPRQVHTLGIADTEPTTQALAQWLTLAGLVPAALVPADAAGMATAVERALSLAGGNKVAVVLYAGEHGSALAAASGGRLRFIRQIGIGSESLVEAMAREIRCTNRAGESKTVTLDHAGAAALLETQGIPDRAQVVDAARGITGDALLPLVQPILQRCVVEIKQSLRFGLEEKEREIAVLFGIGPGTRVPRFMALISQLSGLTLGEAGESGTDSNRTIDAWLNGRGLSVNLLPREVRARQTSRRVTRCLYVGVAAAAALIGTDAFMTRTDLAEQNAAVASLKQRLDAAKTAISVQSRLVAAQTTLAAARQRLAARMAAEANWESVLAMLSRMTPEKVRLTQVQLTVEDGRPMCRLMGHARMGTDPNAQLKSYMDALTSVPIVQTCRLGATQRGEGPKGPVQNFEITLSLVDLPPATSELGSLFTSAPIAKETEP